MIGDSHYRIGGDRLASGAGRFVADVRVEGVHATTNPLGLRGLGECGNPGLGGAIANAVCDALRDRGVGITSLPLTPALVFEAIRSALDRETGR